MAGLAQDFRFALRLLGRSPLATLVAIGSLALGIGSTTAAFNLIDGLLLRPLPALPHAKTLVAVSGVLLKYPDKLRHLTWADYLDYASQKAVFSELAASVGCDLNLTQDGPAERLPGLAVSSNYFKTLGLKPGLGRLLTPADEKAAVAVLGHELWRRRFGADPGVIGSAIRLNGQSLTVVGVAPRGFAGTSLSARREIWVPLGVYSDIAKGTLVPFTGRHDRKQEWLDVVGRLASGMSRERAQSALQGIAAALAVSYPEAAGRSVRVLPLAEHALGPGNGPLFVDFSTRLLAITVLVLAVALANVAGLLLTRALARQKEVAVRLSLGVGRGRLMRQFLAEGVALAVLGLGAGTVLANASLPLLNRLSLPVDLAVREVTFSHRTFGFALLVSLASCLLLACVPVLQTLRSRHRLLPRLRGDALQRHAWGFLPRELLAGGQVALSLLVVIAAGLMLRTLSNLAAIDPGYDPSGVLAVSIDLAPAGYEGRRVAEFYRDLLERLRKLPGVKDASMASALPVMGNELVVDLTVTLDDAQPAAGDTEPTSQVAVRHVLVGSRFFQTTRLRLLRGRDFGLGDSPSSPGALVVNETAGQLLWRGKDPLGRRLLLAGTEAPFEVIGVVGDSTYGSLKEKAVPVLYLSHSQHEKSMVGSLLAPQMTIFLRAFAEPWGLLGQVKETVRALDSRVPVFEASTLEELLAATVGIERQAAALFSGLALVATALAMLGLWGVLTQVVLERTREIGIRVSCGAGPVQVRALVLKRSLVITLGGAAAGLAVAVPARRIVASQLYGVGAADLATWLGATLGLLVLALLVSAAPAHRATKIDPVSALKYE